MGENVTPPADGTGLPPPKAPRESLERGAAPVTTQVTRPTSSPIPSSGEIPRTVEKAYCEQIIENAPEAISIVDEEHRILRINGQFTRLFGFTADEAAGKTLAKLIVPPDRSAETAWLSQSAQAGKSLTLETRRQKKDGSLVEVLLSI